jgi:hypothetical protein
MTALEELKNIEENYQDACKLWQTIKKMLSDYYGWRNEENESDDHRITCQFTDTKLFCRFSFKNGKAVLTYGYVDQDEYMRIKHVPIGQQFVDKVGNIKETLEATTSSWNIANYSDYERFFFPQILAAQKKAWEK